MLPGLNPRPPQMQNLSLLKMLQGLFATETIEDYTCIKCSIRAYLKEEGKASLAKRESASLKRFLERLVAMPGELD